MGRSVSDNFKKRFGNPERIEIKFETAKLSPLAEVRRSEATATAYVDVLRGILGREPTHEKIIGKADISKTKKREAK